MGISVKVSKPGKQVKANLLQGTKKAGQTRLEGITGLAASDVQTALEELSYRHFQSSVTPTISVTAGDLWSDTSANELKLYTGSSWIGVGGGDLTNLSDTYYKFTATPALTSGNVAEFKNFTTSVLKVQWDGVIVLKEQSSPPTAVSNALYSDGDDLYYGNSVVG